MVSVAAVGASVTIIILVRRLDLVRAHRRGQGADPVRHAIPGQRGDLGDAYAVEHDRLRGLPAQAIIAIAGSLSSGAIWPTGAQGAFAPDHQTRRTAARRIVPASGSVCVTGRVWARVVQRTLPIFLRIGHSIELSERRLVVHRVDPDRTAAHGRGQPLRTGNRACVHVARDHGHLIARVRRRRGKLRVLVRRGGLIRPHRLENTAQSVIAICVLAPTALPASYGRLTDTARPNRS